MDLEQLAEDVAASVLAWSPESGAGCTVESAERVEHAGDGAAVVVLWTQTTPAQGPRRFGLLMSMSAYDFPGVTTDAVVRNLLYMLREPHATKVTDRTRTWYTQLAPIDG